MAHLTNDRQTEALERIADALDYFVAEAKRMAAERAASDETQAVIVKSK